MKTTAMKHGKWDTINNYFKQFASQHHSNYEGYTNYDLLINWLALKFNRPTQKLPALVMRTKYMKDYSNMLILIDAFFRPYSKQLNSFTDHYTDFLNSDIVIIYKENFTFANTNLPYLINDEKCIFNEKNLPVFEIYQNTSFVIETKNFNDFQRDYFVLISSDLSGTFDPKLHNKMIEELPAFKFFLRKILTLPNNNSIFFNKKPL